MYNISKYLKDSFNKLSPFTTAKSQFIPMIKHWGFLDSFRKKSIRRGWANIWGTVHQFDFCKKHNKEYHGHNVEDVPHYERKKDEQPAL